MKKLRIIVSVLFFLLAIPIGLEFVLYDAPYSFSELKGMVGFWISWASSTAITFVGMIIVECATRLVNQQWPWNTDWLIRLSVQVAVGVLLPLATVVAWNAGFFYTRDATLNLEPYLESEFWLVVILLVIHNAVCSLLLVIWADRKVKGSAGAMRYTNRMHTRDNRESLAEKVGIDVSALTNTAAYIEVSGRTCIIYRFDGGKEVYTVTLDAMEIALKGAIFCRIHRKHIVNRKAIAVVETNLAKHACSLSLVEPYTNKSLRVGPAYLNTFLNWMEMGGD